MALNRVKEYRNGWYVIMDRDSTLYRVVVRNAAGDLHDKVRCDAYRDALEYWRAFNAIAKAA